MPSAYAAAAVLGPGGLRLRSLALLLILAGLVPVAIFGLLMTYRLWTLERARLEAKLLDGTDAVMRAVDQELAEHLQALRVLGGSSSLDRGDAEAFRHEAEQLVRAGILRRPLSLDDAEGRRLVDLPLPDGTAVPSGLAGGLPAGWPPGRPHVSGLRETEAGGRRLILLSLEVQRGDRTYTIASALPPAQIGLGQMHGFAPDWTVSVIDGGNLILTRNRSPEQFIGRPVTESLSALLASARRLAVTTNQEGDRIYTATARSQLADWRLAVGMPAGALEGPARRSLLLVLAAGAASVALAAAGLWIALRSFLRRRAEAEATNARAQGRAFEERLSAVAANFPGVIFRRVIDAEGEVSYPFVSDGVRSFGLDPSLFRGARPDGRFTRLLHPEDRKLWRRAIRRSADTLEPYAVDGRLTLPNGEVRWMHAAAQPARGRGGETVWDGVMVDISAQKQVEGDLRGALAAKMVLLQEVHHRVKNNLQLICSLMRLQWTRLDDPLLRTAFQASLNRVVAMGLVHDVLYANDDLADLAFGLYLDRLASKLLDAYECRDRIRIEVAPSEVRLGLDRAIPVALIANELISNALEHAFPGGRVGRVAVSVGRIGGEIVLAVADDGVGMPAGDAAKGLGSKVVEALSGQLRARFSRAGDAGARAELRFPS